MDRREHSESQSAICRHLEFIVSHVGELTRKGYQRRLSQIDLELLEIELADGNV